MWRVGLIGVIVLGGLFGRGCKSCCGMINCCKSVRGVCDLGSQGGIMGCM